MNTDDVIEELAFELFERSHEPSFSDDAQGLDEARAWARKIATDLLPTRDEIAKALFVASDMPNAAVMAQAWDAPGDGGRQRWWDYADAVLALLEGRDG